MSKVDLVQALEKVLALFNQEAGQYYIESTEGIAVMDEEANLTLLQVEQLLTQVEEDGELTDED